MNHATAQTQRASPSQYIDRVCACTLQPFFNAVNKDWNTYTGHASAVQALWKLLQQVTQGAGAIASSIRDGLASSCFPAPGTNLRGLLSVLQWVLHARPRLLGTLCIRPIMAAVLLGKSVTAVSSASSHATVGSALPLHPAPAWF